MYGNPSISTDEITLLHSKTVPGTYSEDNYGEYIDDLKRLIQRNVLNVKKKQTWSWSVSAKTLENPLIWLTTHFGH
jgi:hypothetical protein